MTIVEPAYAKLNLSLDVLGKRPDGYHDMEMLFQLISIHDDVIITITDNNVIQMSTDSAFLPVDRTNIAFRCAERFLEEIREKRKGCSIILRKRIPVCAGMGGGSADGAAVLRALNRAFDTPLSMDQLVEMSVDIGADIPFCIIGGTAVGRGRGELLEPLPDLQGAWFVVVKPSFSVSTPELFRKLDKTRVTLHPDTQGLICALRDGDIRKAGRRLFNVFEDVLPGGIRTVEEIKSVLLDCGAVGAAMTGTGSAVFGMFDKADLAENACLILSKVYSDTWVAEPVGHF